MGVLRTEISTAYHRNGLVNEKYMLWNVWQWKRYALERLARREKGVLRAAHTYTAIIRECPPPPGSEDWRWDSTTISESVPSELSDREIPEGYLQQEIKTSCRMYMYVSQPLNPWQGRTGREILFPTTVPDPQYELICIQPIRATWYEYEWLASSE